jgi:ATP-binding cassette subfamily B protein
MKKLKEMFGSLAFLLGLYKKYALSFLIGTVVFWACYGPINSILQVQMQSRVIGAVANGLALKNILIIAAVIGGIQLVFNIIVQIFQNIFQQPQAMKLRYKIDGEIYEKAALTDYKYYDNPEFFADFTWAAQNFGSQMEQARSILENTIQNFAQFAAMALYISMVGPWVLLVSVISIAGSMFIQLKQNKMNFKMNEEIMPHSRRLSYFQRMFYTREPAADIKTTKIKGFFFSMYDDAVGKYVKRLRKFYTDITLLGFLQNILNQATQLLMITLIVKSVFGNNVTDIGRYSALLAASSQMQQGLQSLIWQFTNLQQVTLYMTKIKKFFDIEPDIEATTGDDPGEGALSLELDDITFAYGEPDAEKRKNILDGLKMSIKAGEKIAIVGENGVGKSTLMKLLMRLYDVNSGEIKVNGRPIKEYDVRQLRYKIGIAFQDSMVYSLPMSENLQLYRDAEPEKLAEILEKVGLHKLLDNEGGLNAQLTREFDDNGVMLSGGEMQKFVLARLLTGRFGLLILDEPTAALDPLAEYELNKLILDRSRPETTIVVAHRLATIRDADRIFLIDDGKVAEVGSHAELMALGGKYCEMFTKQAEKYQDN